jgi:hypothetical protein
MNPREICDGHWRSSPNNNLDKCWFRRPILKNSSHFLPFHTESSHLSPFVIHHSPWNPLSASETCGDPVIQTNQLWEILAHGCYSYSFWPNLTENEANSFCDLKNFSLSFRSACFSFCCKLLRRAGLMLTLMSEVEKFWMFSQRETCFREDSLQFLCNTGANSWSEGIPSSW